MAEAGLCTVWGTPVPGREKVALDVYSEALQYWGRLQEEGKIEQPIPDVLEGDKYSVRVVLGPRRQTLGLTEKQCRLEEGELTRIVHHQDCYAHCRERDSDPA